MILVVSFYMAAVISSSGVSHQTIHVSFTELCFAFKFDMFFPWKAGSPVGSFASTCEGHFVSLFLDVLICVWKAALRVHDSHHVRSGGWHWPLLESNVLAMREFLMQLCSLTEIDSTISCKRSTLEGLAVDTCCKKLSRSLACLSKQSVSIDLTSSLVHV